MPATSVHALDRSAHAHDLRPTDARRQHKVQTAFGRCSARRLAATTPALMQ
jgi:hypothetical protein